MTDGDSAQTDDGPGELLIARQLRQRLEALHRAGISHIPFHGGTAIAASRTPAEPAPKMIENPVSPIEIQEVQVRAPQPTNPPEREPEVVKRPAGSKTETKSPSPTVPVTSVTTLFGDKGFDSPAVPHEVRASKLLEIAEVVAKCPKCPLLVATRTQTVFGDGSPTARLMFIGEAPGAEEDRRGVPFVGRAGILLTDMITKGMGLQREEVYIANILKCRPPENRDPQPDECAHCMPYLEQQLEIIRPEFLCLLGRIASQNLLQTTVPMGKLRGRWHSVCGIKTLVTYHPSYLLRNPPAKKDAWEDLQIIMKEMGLPISPRKK